MNKSLADIMAKCCVVFSQSPFEDLTTFRVRHVLLLVSILKSNAPGQWNRVNEICSTSSPGIPAVAVVALNCRGIKLGVGCWGGGGPALGMGAAEVRVDENFPWLDRRGRGWSCGWGCGCSCGWWTMAGGRMGTYKGTNTGYTQLSHFNVNTLRRNKNGRHLADDIFKRIFDSENVWISIKISLKFNVPKGPINNITALVQIMAWRHPGDKPLSEPMLVSLTMPQWVNP